MKSECGYKLAREIIRDSELEVKFISIPLILQFILILTIISKKLEESQLFFSNSEPTDEEDRIFDKQVQ